MKLTAIETNEVSMLNKKRSGFTLIEVMIVVAIVGVLAAIAFPSYTRYVLRSYRAEARNMLLETTQWLEKNYTVSQSYALAADGVTAINTASLTTAGLNVVPKGSSGSSVRYTLSFSVAPTAAAYTLLATRAGAQTADTACGDLTLNNLQVRGRTGTGASIEECWSR